MNEIEKARAFLQERVSRGAALFLMADAPDTYWPIGAWRLEPGFFVLYVAGGSDQQAHHIIRFDEARMDHEHFLSFFVGGKYIGGICEMDPDQKAELSWDDYTIFLQTPEGAKYREAIEARAEYLRTIAINDEREGR